eukprot:Gb_35432 [translate_table: standard]
MKRGGVTEGRMVSCGEMEVGWVELERLRRKEGSGVRGSSIALLPHNEQSIFFFKQLDPDSNFVVDESIVLRNEGWRLSNFDHLTSKMKSSSMKSGVLSML